ncbi:hypothetical protein SJAG_02957 [Schizosaccharomyces japonicus yFS275]|uniref:RTA1 like protein n=1 Tax=Schizosaccharomyces japonicus (strain yFS275 / FY16936) TaxID=402676 RepID=B6K2Y2_SCHJY|nr:hypothetical protein SJAG_02957 [Schizosaccharomyces japonicus yFS275]EEB07839.1 hypothetical protein SJAG_02957 [Schizosaccharomyces japonicus yFS275]
MQLLDVYGYTPTKWLNIVATICFAACSQVNIFQVFKYRSGIPLLSFVASLGEAIGWVARQYSAKHITSTAITSYSIQYVTIMAFPVFYTAQMYITLKHLIIQYGPEYAFLRPRLYGLVFIICDIISMFIQFAGGGMAGGANGDAHKESVGSNIMLFGICYQLVMVLAFTASGVDFWYRYSHNKPYRSAGGRDMENLKMGLSESKRRALSAHCLWIATVLVIIRSIYRVIELAQGWSGKLIKTEAYLGIFDFVPMFLTSVMLIPSVWTIVRGDEAVYRVNDPGNAKLTDVSTEKLTNYS